MEIIFIAVVLSVVIFGLVYAHCPFMQSEEFKQMDDEEDIWDRWP